MSPAFPKMLRCRPAVLFMQRDSIVEVAISGLLCLILIAFIMAFGVGCVSTTPLNSRDPKAFVPKVSNYPKSF